MQIAYLQTTYVCLPGAEYHPYHKPAGVPDNND